MSIHLSTNIFDHPSVDPTVQVCNSDNRYFDKTWYKYKVLSDNMDRTSSIIPPTFLQNYAPLQISVITLAVQVSNSETL